MLARTKVDIGLASMSATNPGFSGNGTALLERDELMEVMEIGEHLLRNQIRVTCLNHICSTMSKPIIKISEWN
jgi:hypothetical protein